MASLAMGVGVADSLTVAAANDRDTGIAANVNTTNVLNHRIMCQYP